MQPHSLTTQLIQGIKEYEHVKTLWVEANAELGETTTLEEQEPLIELIQKYHTDMTWKADSIIHMTKAILGIAAL